MRHVGGGIVRRAFARFAASCCAGVAFGAVACRAETPVIALERAVLVLPAGGAPAAVYLTVRNSSAMALEVVGVEVEGADTTVLQSVTAHRMPDASASRGPTALLSPVPLVPIAAGGTLRFAPGGYTVVVSGLRRPLVRGDSVRITVRLSNAWSRSAMARVLAYADLDTALGTARPSVTTATPDTQPTATMGKALYLGNGCATCHGLLGDGTGPVGRTLSPPPRNFRLVASFKNGADELSIAQTLATGIPNGGAMPLYAHLTHAERRALAMYVLSFVSSTSFPDIKP